MNDTKWTFDVTAKMKNLKWSYIEILTLHSREATHAQQGSKGNMDNHNMTERALITFRNQHEIIRYWWIWTQATSGNTKTDVCWKNNRKTNVEMRTLLKKIVRLNMGPKWPKWSLKLRFQTVAWRKKEFLCEKNMSLLKTAWPKMMRFLKEICWKYLKTNTKTLI